MKKNYLKLMVLSCLLLASTVSMAIGLPYAKAPEDGKTYMLVSRVKPSSFVVKTSWDGALYLQGYDLARITDATVTAQKNEDGSFYFYQPSAIADEEGNEVVENHYMGIPVGTDNLHIEELDPVVWILEQSDQPDYYLLKAGTGQGNPSCEGGYLHLNKGCEYLVITEPSSQWFPDFYGGWETDETGDYVFDETGFIVPKDPVSRYWAFVELEDVPAYQQKVELYALLQDLENNYLGLDGYAEGFKKAYDAAVVYYEKNDFTADDLAAAKEIVNARMNLYREIVADLELLANGNPSAVFSAAIDAATAAFNADSSVEQLQAALTALQEAKRNYAMGSDDLTVLIQNNSFEDLSAQNGNTQDGGVAAAPAGWNIFINGKQTQTASEIQAAGISGWAGANADCDGQDGNVAYGVWNSGIPEFEISQTVTGLENGSYDVYALLMVGANGNGSRRTTQRIFGNLNAKYFASQEEYNEERLDQSEVYSFEGLTEPVTDRQLQEISVRAFVYDGTLTLGMRTNGDIAAANRETGNGAGGDGWFKLDNFRLFKVGYVQDDALAVYNHFAVLFDNLIGQQMQKSIKEQAQALLGGNIGATSSKEEIINAIKTLKEMYPTVLSSVKAYTSLMEAISKGYAALVEYDHSTSADDFGDLLMEAEDMFDEALADEAQIAQMVELINQGIEELKATSVVMGDITYVVKNPSFEDLSSQNNSVSDGAQPAPTGWTLTLDGEVVTTAPGLAWCAINHGDPISVIMEDGTEINHQYTDGEHLWGIWNSNIPEVELSQTIKNMPSGTYTLQADVMVQYNWAGDCTTTQRIFGNNFVQMWGTEEAYSELNLPEDAKNAAVLTYAGWVCAAGQDGIYNSDLLHPMKVVFEVGEDGVAKIGFRTNGVNADGLTFADGGLNGQGWFKVDNFRLSYDSEELASVKGVQQNTGKSAVSFYSLDGRLLQAPQRGINIVRTGDKTRKVIVK